MTRFAVRSPLTRQSPHMQPNWKLTTGLRRALLALTVASCISMLWAVPFYFAVPAIDWVGNHLVAWCRRVPSSAARRRLRLRRFGRGLHGRDRVLSESDLAHSAGSSRDDAAELGGCGLADLVESVGLKRRLSVRRWMTALSPRFVNEPRAGVRQRQALQAWKIFAASCHPGVRLRRDPRLLTSTLSAWETML